MPTLYWNMGKPNWYGSKKKKDSGCCSRKQSIQFNPSSRNNTIKFINKPLSNIDLLYWVRQLGIKYFRVIYRRDNLPEKIHRLETAIINLDHSIGRGSHWVCYIELWINNFVNTLICLDQSCLMRLKIIWKQAVKKLCIRQMKYKKETVFYAVIGAYIIF